jgi:integrase
MRQQMLPTSNWPPADLDRWQVETAIGASLTDDGGNGAHLAPRSRDDLERRYGYFLGWAHRTGRLDASAGPAETVTPDNMEAYIADVEGHLSSVTLAGSVSKILRVAGLLAPKSDWEWLKQKSARLAAGMKPADKRARVVESDQLYRLGMDLMDEAEAALAVPRRSKHRPARRPPRIALGPSIQMAERYRDGLMIAMLAACAIRRGNLTGQAIGGSLVRREGGWSIEIPGCQVKNRRALAMPLPEDLGYRLDRFLAVFRHAIRGSVTSDRLWFSRRGAPLTDGAVYLIVTRWTQARLGKRVNPHLFRDCLVTTMAVHHGAHIRAASAALGHVDERIANKHYNQASMIDGVRRLQAAALARAQGTRDPGADGKE